MKQTVCVDLHRRVVGDNGEEDYHVEVNADFLESMVLETRHVQVMVVEVNQQRMLSQ